MYIYIYVYVYIDEFTHPLTLLGRWALLLSWPPHSPETVGLDLLKRRIPGWRSSFAKGSMRVCGVCSVFNCICICTYICLKTYIDMYV